MRALHWVLKTGDLASLVDFLKDPLGMHALRHEEFQDPCPAACNGPFQGRWSKTMMGYGPEDSNFALEIVRTYTVRSYDMGNDLAWIKIRSRSAYQALEEQGLGTQVDMRVIDIKSPDGYAFRVVGEDPAPDVGPISSICLNVTDLERSLAFWVDVLGLLEVDRGDDFVALACAATSATLRLSKVEHVRRGTAAGRLALSCATSDLQQLQESVQAAGYTVVTPLTSLETPGKSSVKVVVAVDPDGHEVCLVGDAEFRRLSQPDEAAPQLLGEAIAKDTSHEWFDGQAEAAERQGREGTGGRKEKAAAIAT